MTTSPLQADNVEIAVGMMLGRNNVSRIPASDGRRTVRQVLEDHVLQALLKPPCIVSFSGGRDSSSILALAAHVARRHGLDAPIPVTLVFPDFPETQEEDWQRVALDHIGVGDWVRLPHKYELDLVGPVWRRVADRLGVLFPSNAYVHAPIMEAASQGSVLTGIGGDEVLDTPGHPALRALAGYGPLRRSHARAMTRLIAPPALRRQFRRRHPIRHGVTWLTENGWEQVAERQAEQLLPERMSAALRRWNGDRYYGALVDSFDRLAGLYDTKVCNPLLEPDTIAALAHDAGAAGFRSRQAALERYVGDLLPIELLSRRSKATFNGPFHGPETELAANRWRGDGLTGELIQGDRLADALRSGHAVNRWSMLIQWLVLNGHTSSD
jgi:hypothetical protein